MLNLRGGTRPGNVTVSCNREKCTDNGSTMHRTPAAVNRNECDPLLPINSLLPPVTGDPDPASRPAHPVAPHPYSPRIWTSHPGAGNPFVACSGPTPVTACPHVRRPGRNCLRFNPNG